MRRSRLGRHAGSEFPSSGEDSFVAVVVTKLTGALLFLLLLVMVIMALLPKAMDMPTTTASGEDAPAPMPLTIVTPEDLPEAIAGRPYSVALAAHGAVGPLQWALDGPLPEGLAFDSDSGMIRGTPLAGTPEPVEMVVRVTDGSDRDSRLARLVIYQPDSPLSTPSRWAPGLPPIPWNAWLNQGFGFLMLLMVHMVGMNTLVGLERRSDSDSNPSERATRRRFLVYRWLLRLVTLGALVGLAGWLWLQREA